MVMLTELYSGSGHIVSQFSISPIFFSTLCINRLRSQVVKGVGHLDHV